MEFGLRHTSLSCVHYQQEDDLGKLLAYVALGPIFIIVFQFSKVYTRREVHEAMLLLGLVLEEAVARLLKDLLRHPRPATCKMLHMCHSHGMPSSHTSMMFCYFVITSCWALQNWSKRSTASKLLSLGEQVFCAVSAVAVSTSRVYLGYHSIDQVIAGAAFGSAFALLWLGVMAAASPGYPALGNMLVFKQLGVKDTYNSTEPLLTEQQAHCSKMAAGRAKHS
jgi:dolichyldiphosphatase